MAARYSLKPYHSAKTPSLKWVVTGPRKGLRRWRRLFETLEEAQGFLREKQNATPKPVVAIRPPLSVPPKGAGRHSRRPRRRSWATGRTAGILATVIVVAFLIDRIRQPTFPVLGKDVLLAEDFEENPILSRWSVSPTGAGWSAVEIGSTNKAISVGTGTWSSPPLSTEPLQWYRLAFRSLAPGKPPDPGAIGCGYCRVLYFDVQGNPLPGDDVSSILQSKDWRSNELRLRSPAQVDSSGELRAVRMKIVFAPMGGAPFCVDDVKLEKVSTGEVNAWSEKSYAELPARLGYQPKASRWKHLPKTAEKLKKGKPLRILLLGDSVQQELANAPVDAILKAHLPYSHVEIFASTKPATGVEFFKDHLSDFVTKYRPDLLIIGGISNRGGIPAFQEFVDGVRAHDVVSGRRTEMLIVTPPWSPNVNSSHPKAFSLGPQINELGQDTSGEEAIPNDERWQLVKFAEANDVEFLDMMGIVSEFIYGPAKVAGVGPPISADGYPSGFWMRDWVHPNGAGRQIMGRILAQYLLSEPMKELESHRPRVEMRSKL
jgi:hypothetical protein